MSHILSVLENFSLDNADDITIGKAHNFRKHWIEKKQKKGIHANFYANGICLLK